MRPIQKKKTHCVVVESGQVDKGRGADIADVPLPLLPLLVCFQVPGHVGLAQWVTFGYGGGLANLTGFSVGFLLIRKGAGIKVLKGLGL